MTRDRAQAPAMQIENLGKRYVLKAPQVAGYSFREMVMDTVRAPVKRYKTLVGHVNEQDTFWALKHLSFDIGRGEVVGVIGRNGAGKSTLLKVLTRITPPTEGRAWIYGQVCSLLEVGTGFHPELTGRDNVFLNGAILGMSRSEISRKFDDIVEFAEVNQFIDTPVKRYSNGMHVRLGFSVAAHLDPDVLLVDEVLAVGDKRFQERSIGKLHDVASSGRTVLYVSHNMGSIMELCDRCIVLDRGRLIFEGPAEAAVRQYLDMMSEPGEGLHPGMFRGPLSDRVFFNELRINGKVANGNMLIAPSDKILIECHGESCVELADFNIFASIYKDGLRLVSIQDAPAGTTLRAGRFTSEMELAAYFLRPGIYTVGIDGQRMGQYQWLAGMDVARFTVLEQWHEGYEERDHGVINSASHGHRRQ